VVPDREAKSVGHEETFAEDIGEPTALVTHLWRMVDAATNQLRRDGLAARTVTVKVRFGDFSTITRSRTSRSPLDAGPAVMVVAEALLDSVDTRRGVRLLGVSLSGFAGIPDAEQLALDLDDHRAATDEDRDDAALEAADAAAERLQRTWSEVTGALDAVRDRFGDGSLGSAALVGRGGLAPRRRGEAQWGPSTP
jgi:DNA polymerase-4